MQRRQDARQVGAHPHARTPPAAERFESWSLEVKLPASPTGSSSRSTTSSRAALTVRASGHRRGAPNSARHRPLPRPDRQTGRSRLELERHRPHRSRPGIRQGRQAPGTRHRPPPTSLHAPKSSPVSTKPPSPANPPIASHAAEPAAAPCRETQPEFIQPQLAQESRSCAACKAAGWLHELKLDGYRMQARKSGAWRADAHQKRP